MPFQRRNLLFCIKNKARVLLAEEPGLNRILQSLALAFLYKEAWPFLIITPSFLKPLWLKQIAYYLEIPFNEVQILCKKADLIAKSIKVLIVPFEIVSKGIIPPNQLLFAIVDEILLLKDPRTEKNKLLIPYFSKTKHLILLSNRLSLQRPKELFPALQCLRPGLFKEFEPFGNRYCDPKPSVWGLGEDYSGFCNERELAYWLKGGFMIGSRRGEVNEELGDFIKETIPLEIEEEFREGFRKIKEGFLERKDKEEVFM